MSKNLILAALWVLLAPENSRAVDAVLQKARGKILIRAAGEKSFDRASAGAPLLFGDQVKTMADSLAHIVFADGPAILIKENSNLTLEGTRKEPQVSFKLGEFLIGLRKKLDAGRSFRVKTPAAIAAVRGTLFWGLSDKKKDTMYSCFGSVISIEAQGETVELNAGQMVTIPFGKAPQAAKPANIPLSTLDTFAVDGSIEGFKDLVDHP